MSNHRDVVDVFLLDGLSSQKKRGVLLDLFCFNPYVLDQTNSMEDIQYPPRTVDTSPLRHFYRKWQSLGQFSIMNFVEQIAHCLFKAFRSETFTSFKLYQRNGNSVSFGVVPTIPRSPNECHQLISIN